MTCEECAEEAALVAVREAELVLAQAKLKAAKAAYDLCVLENCPQVSSSSSSSSQQSSSSSSSSSS